MKFLIHYLDQSNIKKGLILFLFFCAQFLIQYCCLIENVKNNYDEMKRCHGQEEKVFLKIKNDTRVLCNKLVKINNIKNQLKIKSLFEFNYLLLSVLKNSNLTTKNIAASRRFSFNVAAEGDFDGLIRLLTEFVRNKNLIATYFLVEKFDQKQKLSFFINVVTI